MQVIKLTGVNQCYSVVPSKNKSVCTSHCSSGEAGEIVLFCPTAPCICDSLGVSGIARPEERDGVLSWDAGMVAVPVLRDIPSL